MRLPKMRHGCLIDEKDRKKKREIHPEGAKMMKLFRAPLSGLFAILLLFILLITSFELVCYSDPGYYRAEFEKYDVAGEMEYYRGESISLDSLSQVIRQTMLYLRGRRGNLIVETEINGKMQEFYQPEEKSHMADVRRLFLRALVLRGMAILSCLAILGSLILFEPERAVWDLSRSFTLLCLLLLLLSLAIGALMLCDFTKYFTLFHELFFPQGNWSFDPRESRMIVMLPENFFLDTALRVLLCFFAFLLLLLLPSVRYLLWKRGYHKAPPS